MLKSIRFKFTIEVIRFSLATCMLSHAIMRTLAFE